MKLVVLGLVTAAAALAQVVEGTVVSAPDGATLAGVKVELAQNGYAMRRAMTDSQGAFRFDAVAEGDYTAEYTKPGYVQVGQGFNDLISIAGQAARRPVHVTAGADYYPAGSAHGAPGPDRGAGDRRR